MLRSVALTSIIALIVTSCQAGLTLRPAASAPPVTVSPQARPVTPVPTYSPTAPAARAMITLTVWLPDMLVPPGNTQANAVLMQQMNDFAAAHPDIQVQVLVKRAYGAGSILDLMRTAALVAPSILPDVALLDLAEVPEALRLGLLHPLDSVMPEGAPTDLFPFAEAGRSDNRWCAIAYAVDIEHVAYNAAHIHSAPLTWAQVLSAAQPYLFPAGAVGGMPADVLFAQYAAAGGQWTDSAGQPRLDTAALTQMLQQLQDAQRAGAISSDILDIASADDTWLLYIGSPAQMVDVYASRFIQQRTAVPNTMAAPLPGYSETARPIARGWALIMPTHDPAHQPAAAALIAWLAQAESEGAWTRTANLLPARRSAFAYWYPAGSYTAFIRQELERAIPPPSTRIAQAIGPALQKAVAEVLRGQAQPAEAAKTAAASVGRMAR